MNRYDELSLQKAADKLAEISQDPESERYQYIIRADLLLEGLMAACGYRMDEVATIEKGDVHPVWRAIEKTGTD